MIAKKIKFLFISAVVLAGTGFLTSAIADYLPVQVYATETVAGYPASLRTSLINPNQDVRFVVEKPDGSVIQIPAQADLEGIAKTDLYGHQTKIAGKYKAAVVYPGSPTSSPQTTLTVYPDQVSASQSTLRSTEQMVQAGSDVTFLIATLYDQYRNPIPNHLVKLVSSRSEDVIETLQGGVSDNNGRANFKVKSQYPGISVFSAMDVTMNQVLDDREEVVFFTPTEQTQSPFAANLLSANVGGDGETLPGPVQHFDIEGLASTVKVNEQLSFTVTAKDNNNNVAKNYTGTILISVPDDENATLPNNGEYTFKAADQGKFTFNLSLQFTKIGHQVVQVFDKSNFKIAGEFPLEVVPQQSVVPQPVSPDLEIKSPLDGSELSSNLVIISGKALENSNLKIFDNDVKLGDSSSDADGFFSYEAKNLDNGSHTFYVMSEDNKVSKSVTITIDTIPPVLNSFEMDAEGPVAPGTKVTVTVQSEPKLDQAKLRIQGIEQAMAESSSMPGTYTAEVTAPSNNGTFPIDVILMDKLSNKTEFSNKGAITVSVPEAKKPAKVEGPEGQPGDTVVDLIWNPVTDSERPIKNYKISYGTQLDKLDQTADTQDSKPKWQLRELTNDTQYFISIKAVDTQGLESEEPSVIIAVTPVAPDPCANVDCGEHGTCAEGVCTCLEGWSGVTCNVEQQVIVPQVTATPYDSAVVLSWPGFASAQAYYYKIYIGITPGQYTDYAVTNDNSTTYTVKDLINNAKYYFAVAGLDLNGNQITALSQEVGAMPSGAGLMLAAPSPISGAPFFTQPVYQAQLSKTPIISKTGPEALWVIFSSIVFAYFLYSNKRRLLFKIKSR